MIRNNICVLLLVCCLLLSSVLVPVGICAAESRQITDQELNRLEHIFDKLESDNQKQQKVLIEQEKALTVSKQELSKAKQSMMDSAELLQKANKSLEQSAREVRKIKAQRTVAYCAAIAGLIYAIFKK